MSRILVELPSDRNFVGTLELQNDSHEVIFGPIPVAGRANDDAALEHGNPSRATTIPYGDSPLGLYRVRGVLESGNATIYPESRYGAHGVIILEPLSGEGALAEATGRFLLFIQGGPSSVTGELVATNGCLRVFDHHQKLLVQAVKANGEATCDCVEARFQGVAQRVHVDNSYDEGDPPPVRASVELNWITPLSPRPFVPDIVAQGEYGRETPGGGEGHPSGSETPGGGEGHPSGSETPGGGEGHPSGPETPGGGEGHPSGPETPGGGEGHPSGPETPGGGEGHPSGPETPGGGEGHPPPSVG